MELDFRVGDIAHFRPSPRKLLRITHIGPCEEYSLHGRDVRFEWLPGAADPPSVLSGITRADHLVHADEMTTLMARVAEGTDE